MDYTNVKTVAIIGAGVAGLSTARSLTARGLQCTLFERNKKLGGVWSDGYLNFGVQVQKELYEFPDWPLPEGTEDFTKGPVVQAYLEDFARHFGIFDAIRFGVEVERVSQTGEIWEVTFKQGNEVESATFDLVVVCIGLYSNKPSIPEFPNQSAFGGEVIHNSLLKSEEQLRGKRVVVVGYGKSATDAAVEAANHGTESHIVFRKVHWPIPQKLAGILPFKWGLLHRMNIALIPPYQTTSSLSNAIHGLGKPLVWFYWRLVETLLRFQCRLGSKFGTRISLVPEERIEIGAFNEATMVPRPDFFRLSRNGGIDLHKTSVRGFTASGVTLDNGDHIDADMVILATGWETDFSFLDSTVREKLDFEDDGFYLYRHMLHPDVPGLAFVGRASSISSILTYCLQAHWLGQLVTGEQALPDQSVMTQNIEEMKAWKRSWIPFSGARSARLIAHTQNYHDEILRDIKINPYRKKGLFAPLKELIFPYQPSDYAEIFKS